MAASIDRASVVIICCSREYKESANCHAEAAYANTKRKRGKLDIVFLMMDPEYRDPEGWLGLMLGDSLYYQGWDPNNLDSTAAQMTSVIGSRALRVGSVLLPSKSAPSHSVSRSVPPVDKSLSSMTIIPPRPAAAEMTVDDVCSRFLEPNGLGHLSDPFRAQSIDGVGIAQLLGMRDEWVVDFLVGSVGLKAGDALKVIYHAKKSLSAN